MQTPSQTLPRETRSQSIPFDPNAEKALSWYGWGSPIGAGLFLVAVGTCAALLHIAGLWH